jgi:hypothetical protein
VPSHQIIKISALFPWVHGFLRNWIYRAFLLTFVADRSSSRRLKSYGLRAALAIGSWKEGRKERSKRGCLVMGRVATRMLKTKDSLIVNQNFNGVYVRFTL